MTKSEILAILPTLQQEDLAAIQATAVFLIGKSSPQPDSRVLALHALLHNITGNFPSIHQMYTIPTWKKNSAIAIDYFFGPKFPHTLTKIGRDALMNFCLKMLIDDMRDHNIPLKPTPIVNHLPRLPEIVYNSFPGYDHWGMNLICKAMNVR